MLKLMNKLGQLRQHERWTRAQLEAYQAESLRRLRDYAYARSPFYQRFHNGLTDCPLQELPVDGLWVLLSGGVNGANDPMLVEALARALTAQSVKVPRITVQHLDVIPKNATGKAPLIKAYRAPSTAKA